MAKILNLSNDVKLDSNDVFNTHANHSLNSACVAKYIDGQFSNILTLCQTVANQGATMGSCNLAAGTLDNVIELFCNYLYIPHRDGIGSDNTKFGTLLLFGMTGYYNKVWIIHYVNGAVAYKGVLTTTDI